MSLRNIFYEYKFIAFAFVLSVIMLFFISPLDLSISKALINTNNIFGIFVQFFGPWPDCFLGFFSSVILFYVKIRNKFLNYFVKIILLIIAISCIIIALDTFLSSNILMEITIVVLSLAAFSFFYFKILSGDLEKKLRRPALYTLQVIVISNLLVFIIKRIAGRERPMDVIFNGAAYTDWFRRGFAHGDTSFPSGHTIAAVSVLSILFFVHTFKPKYDKLALILCIIWFIFVAYFRLVAADHFLTDVCGSMIIGIFTFWIYYKIFAGEHKCQ